MLFASGHPTKVACLAIIFARTRGNGDGIYKLVYDHVANKLSPSKPRDEADLECLILLAKALTHAGDVRPARALWHWAERIAQNLVRFLPSSATRSQVSIDLLT